ncbi:MAG: hypothetical protein Kow0010_18510 [Dehalococcoidia bacterium]
MTDRTTDRQSLTAAQASAIERAGRSHDVLAEAQRVLSTALGRPQPRREAKWADHRAQVVGPGGLYDEFRTEAPWLLGRVDQLAAQFGRVEREAEDLAREVERVRSGDLQNLPAIRADAERMLALLRDLLARETDLIYEQFNEPAALD